MLTIKLALRTLAKRRGRMTLIGVLVAFGTLLIVLGGILSSSVALASRAAIIDHFTGDFIVYSDKSKELPSPFAFTTPLPALGDIDRIAAALDTLDGVAAYAFYAQNYGLIQVERDGVAQDLPFIFYAVDPGPYRKVFDNLTMDEGNYFGLGRDDGSMAGAGLPSGAAGATGEGSGGSGGSGGEGRGILISEYQNAQYLENYGLSLRPGERLTLLGITEGGVNTVDTILRGVFSPRRYRSVFDYINFMDAGTYAALYNYTGVVGLPEDFDAALSAAEGEEASIFGLAGDEAVSSLDVSGLQAQAISGYTMVAVKMADHGKVDAAIAALGSIPGLGVKVARWDAASGFYAQIASALQVAVAIATALVFLVVVMIFMNTLIINVVERTAEIGTMRALGAERSFVARLFVVEALALNLSAAGVAMLLSALVLGLLGNRGLPLPDTISQFLIGGGPLPLVVGPLPFVAAALIVAAVSVLATLYPVRVATRISPTSAMSER